MLNFSYLWFLIFIIILFFMVFFFFNNEDSFNHLFNINEEYNLNNFESIDADISDLKKDIIRSEVLIRELESLKFEK